MACLIISSWNADSFWSRSSSPSGFSTSGRPKRELAFAPRRARDGTCLIQVDGLTGLLSQTRYKTDQGVWTAAFSGADAAWCEWTATYMWVTAANFSSSGEVVRKSALTGSMFWHRARASMVFRVANRFLSRSNAKSWVPTVVFQRNGQKGTMNCCSPSPCFSLTRTGETSCSQGRRSHQ